MIMSKRYYYECNGNRASITVPDEGGYFTHYAKVRDRILAEGNRHELNEIDLSKFIFDGSIDNQFIVGKNVPQIGCDLSLSYCTFAISWLGESVVNNANFRQHIRWPKFISSRHDLNLRTVNTLLDCYGPGHYKITLKSFSEKEQEFHILQPIKRSDGYNFYAYNNLTTNCGVVIKAGCREFNIAEAKEHWSQPLSYWCYGQFQNAKEKKEVYENRRNLNKQALAIVNLFEHQLRYEKI